MPSQDERQEARRIGVEIARIGFVLPGTLTERYLTCVHAGCHCHADPPQKHGPYWYWTRKVNGKTVTRSLPAEQVEDYRAWFENEKRIRALVRELESLSLSIFTADPRWPKPRRKPGADDPARSAES